MAKRKVGGNTKIVQPDPSARRLILRSQKEQLRAYKYDLQAKVRSDISGPHSGAVLSQGSLSSFKIVPRNTPAKKVTGPNKALSGGVKKPKVKTVKTTKPRSRGSK